MTAQSSKHRLPQKLKPLFWEYDFNQMRWDKHRDLIMLKVLSAGGMSDWKWLRRRVGADELRDWIVARKGRGLTPRQVSFWGVVLGIPLARSRAG